MIDLGFLLQKDIIEGSQQFFKGILDIFIAPATRTQIDLKTWLKDYITDEKILNKVEDARFIGMINDTTMDGSQKETETEFALKQTTDDYDMLLVFGLKIKEGISVTKTEIARLTKAINRRSFSRPVIVLIRYGEKLSFSAAERGHYKSAGQQGEKIGRISILRDINLLKVHAGHERILLQLQINPLKVTTFKELYEQWQEVFNVSILNKEFYNELFTWYLWAVRSVSFPYRIDDKKDDTVNKSENVIRLLTRLIFVWFVKEKGLIKEELFDKKGLSYVLKKFNPDADDNSDFYKAILQNLFFATLNTEMPKDGGIREFIDYKKKNPHTGYSDEYMDHLSYRHKDLFIDPVASLKLFENIPFLNGGLFECLDRTDPDTKEETRIDGFSTKKHKQPTIPNVLFFGKNDDLDLSAEFENGNRYKHTRVRGLINILNSYKFTIEENTPLEQEIALDPELLGKIFENLLASYNPETQTTARKQTGSYYTPREIVNYMVDESLIAYLKTKLTRENQVYVKFGSKQTTLLGNEVRKQLSLEEKADDDSLSESDAKLENKLRDLFAYEIEENPFKGDSKVTKAIISHLSECKILDPACGSGAFPMGILHKIVLALGKIDPCNLSWKQAQLDKAKRDKERAKQFEDETLRQTALKSADEKIGYIEESFGKTGHELDYTRKLFLIENCIYGVDIQQIAVQISKLRFFISLMVDQTVNDSKRNRNILSLPNLETKFVAANTLIPIEKPQKEGDFYSLIGMDENVKKAENALHEIRQRIFFTRKYSEKKELKKNEKEKRGDLKQALIDSRFPEAIAGQISSWDPFDPLVSAPFFDPEVMFAIEGDGKGGFFNVVIGNPPYGIPIKGDYRKKVTESLGKVPDYEIYYFFINKSHKLLLNNGIKSYIIPNTILFNVYAQNYRSELLDKWAISELLDCTNFKIFEGATVRNVISILTKNNNVNTVGYRPTIDVKSFESLLRNKRKFLEKKQLRKNFRNWGLLFKLDSEFLNLVEKIRNKKLKVSDIFLESSQGIIAYDKYQGQDEETIRNRIYHSFDSSKGWDKWLWGEDVNRYKVKWNNKEFINYCNEIANPRDPKFFKRERVLIREITNPRIFAAHTKEELYNDPAIIIVLDNKDKDLLILLGIINSKLATFYHFNSSPKATKGEFPKILVDDVNSFPIPDLSALSKDQKKVIKNLVINLLDYYKIEDRICPQDNVLDLIVFKLYSLTYDECQIIDPEIGTLISREDYERMGVEELAGVRDKIK